jgi:hypothetical protein
VQLNRHFDLAAFFDRPLNANPMAIDFNLGFRE